MNEDAGRAGDADGQGAPAPGAAGGNAPADAENASGTAQQLTGRTIPARATEDEPRSWGEADEDREAWLREQRPPHWG